jgi:malonate decarboxylase beta subunit
MLELASSWYELSARARLAALLDQGSLLEFLGPERRAVSPHLALFDLPPAFDDGMIVGRGRLDGRSVLVAAQEGRFMGGAIGEVHGAKLVGLLRAAQVQSQPVLILFDTGGVRLQEANAGEVAVAEIMRAVLQARSAGAAVIGLIGGRAGCFGGGGLISACCSRLIISEQGRLGVTGPEVIESNKGVEEFDASDRTLVWRTFGGKHRRLIGAADVFVDDSAESFRAAAIQALQGAPPFDLATLEAEHARLARRLARCGDARDALQMWTRLRVPDPARVPDMTTEEFIALVSQLGDVGHDAR